MMNFRLFWLLTVVRLRLKFSVLDASDCEVLMSGIATVLTRKMHSYP